MTERELYLTHELLAEAEKILDHPMKRKTDPYLARAVVKGHTGRAGKSTIDGVIKSPLTGAANRPWSAGAWAGDLTTGAHEFARQPPTARARLASLIARIRQKRTWYLRKEDQVDQNGYPACVAATGQHWERTEPVRNYRGLGFMEMYRLCKLRDGAPNEDGTWAWALLEVYHELGLVHSSWWWTGPHDNLAIDEWLLNVGSLWWGVYMPESMFRTYNPDTGLWTQVGDKRAIVKVEGHFRYGHEMQIIGTDRKRKTRLIQQSWGRHNWGIDGRAEIADADFDRLMLAGGDLFGVIEQRAA
jgi:hypothetical protein